MHTYHQVVLCKKLRSRDGLSISAEKGVERGAIPLKTDA